MRAEIATWKSRRDLFCGFGDNSAHGRKNGDASDAP